MDKPDEFDLTPDRRKETEKPPKKASTPTPAPAPTPTPPKASSGLTEEEQKDKNKIQVVISDTSPVVVLFGAKTSGKTMTLIRLTRYLRQHNYTVEPDRVFRPGNSKAYQKICDDFDRTISSNVVETKGTSNIGFMLVRVMNRHGEPICQLLEAPGEHFFDQDDPNAPFPSYVNEISNSPNPKTWVFIVERNWQDQSTRASYAQKVIDIAARIKRKDQIIFACHKADKHRALLAGGGPNIKQFFLDIRNQYKGIFSGYRNKTPILNWFRKYNFQFVVFSAGDFNDTDDGGQTYNQGDDMYPAMFWKAILKSVRGGTWS